MCLRFSFRQDRNFYQNSKANQCKQIVFFSICLANRWAGGQTPPLAEVKTTEQQGIQNVSSHAVHSTSP